MRGVLIICDKCKGTGFLEWDVGTHKSELKYGECNKCKGSGRLEKIVSIKTGPFDKNKKEYTRIF